MTKLLEQLKKVSDNWTGGKDGHTHGKRCNETIEPTDDRMNMTIQLEVTKSQGLAMQAMFEYMNSLGEAGSSRQVAFYADGDGNFKPHAKVSFDGEMPELTEEFSKISVVEDHDGDRVYDFDPIGWALHKEEHPEDFPK